MPRQRRMKNEFGMELITFTKKHRLTYQEVADMAGVSKSLMADCTVGRSPGYELIPKVRKFMEDYEVTHPINY